MCAGVVGVALSAKTRLLHTCTHHVDESCACQFGASRVHQRGVVFRQLAVHNTPLYTSSFFDEVRRWPTFVEDAFAKLDLHDNGSEVTFDFFLLEVDANRAFFFF